MIGADTTFLIQLELLESPLHRSAHELLHREILEPEVPLALAPQILAEFIHVSTDPRRFQQPLTMKEALAKANLWWNATEVRPVFPTATSTALFTDWMNQHQLGRNRVLDTQLGATLWSAGVRSLITSNATDFQIFGFKLLMP